MKIFNAENLFLLKNSYLQKRKSSYLKLLIKRAFCLLIIVFVSFQSASGLNKYALIIGIDKYLPSDEKLIVDKERVFTNLDGCVNDALSVKEILTTKFSFADNEFKTLFNSEATRRNILLAIEEIAKKARRGDVVFIYYAGHGSQVKNLASSEADQMDETIVPADSYLAVPDIRDKELNVLFKKIADNGAILTIIFDSCHSGSIGRAFSEKIKKTRQIQPVKNTVNEKGNSYPLINQNVLILSAASDEQTAAELSDAEGNAHGAFTYSLIKVLNSLPNNSPSGLIFESLFSYMKSFSIVSQVPVIEANTIRNASTLIGLDRNEVNDKTFVTILKVVDKEEIVIQAGLASGLYENSMIRRITGSDTIEIQILKNEQLNKSIGKLIKGPISKVKAGTPFEVVSWSIGNMEPLKIYVVPSEYSVSDLKLFDNNFKNVIKSIPYLKIADDPLEYKELNTVFFDGKNWKLRDYSGSLTDLGSNPLFENISKFITEKGFISITYPAVKGMLDKWLQELKYSKSVELSQEAPITKYMLNGTFTEDGLTYSLILSFASENADSIEPMPLRTQKIVTGSDGEMVSTVKKLNDFSLRLARIRGWLLLSNPPEYNPFPYKLAIRNSTSKKIIQDGIVRENDILGLVLLRDTSLNKKNYCTRKYVYVFVIDNLGKSTLLYPLSNVENLLPIENYGDKLPEIIPLGPERLFKVEPPFGNDNYIMLATETPLHNPAILNADGVNSGTRGENESALWNALLGTGQTTRGEICSPSNWKKQVFVIKSAPKSN